MFFSQTELLIAATPDEWETDDSYSEAQVIGEDDLFGQVHTFHKFFDEDWLQFTAEKGHAFKIAAATTNEACDPVIEIYNVDGTSLVIRHDDKGPGESEFPDDWVCPEDGDYYIRVTNNSPYFGSHIGYQISLMDKNAVSLTGYVSGKVTSGGARLAGARLTANGGAGTSLADGSYLMAFKEGTVDISVRKDGYQSSSFSVNVVSTQTARRNVELQKIEAPSQPPVISGTPGIEVFRNFLYSFKPTASDPDGDSITFSISNKPGWAHFNPETGMLVGIPTANDIGIYDGILITVTDSHGKSASLAPFSLEVKITKASPGIYMLLEGND